MQKEENKIFGCQYNLLDGEQFIDTDLKKIFSTILNDDNICVKLFNNNDVKHIFYNDKKIEIKKIDSEQKKKELATTKCSGVFWQFINKNNKIFNKKLYDTIDKKLYDAILQFIKDRDVAETLNILKNTEKDNLINIFDDILKNNGDSIIIRATDMPYVYTREDIFIYNRKQTRFYNTKEYNSTKYQKNIIIKIGKYNLPKGLEPYLSGAKPLCDFSYRPFNKKEIFLEPYDKMYKQILYNIKNPNKNIDKIYRIETKKFTPLLFTP